MNEPPAPSVDALAGLLDATSIDWEAGVRLQRFRPRPRRRRGL